MTIYHWAIDYALRALIITASALAYSPVFNPRRTEDTTYGIWTTVFIAFTERTRLSFVGKRQPPLLIIPQYNLYVSPKSNAVVDASPDDSIHTQSDAVGKKQGLYTDIAVLRQKVSMRTLPIDTPRSTTFLEYMRGFAHDLFFPPENVWVTLDTQVSILIELKPPPTRSPKSISRFYTSLDRILSRAEGQAEIQGHCVMCTKRFSRQESVILIVGAGDWWRCRLWNRKNSKDDFEGVFAGEDYMEYLQAYDDDLAREMQFDDDEIQDELVDLDAVMGAVPEREVFVAANKDAQKKQANNEARYRRLVERRATKELLQKEGDQAWEELEQASYPFSVAQLNLYRRLISPEKGDFIPQDNAEVNEDSISTSSWSPTLRLGTIPSNK